MRKGVEHGILKKKDIDTYFYILCYDFLQCVCAYMHMIM